MIQKVSNTDSVRALFGDWQETVIWSCLANTMGDLYADNLEQPGSVMAILGDFCYLAGKPAEVLAAFKPDWHDKDFIIMVPQNRAWGEMIEKVWGKKAKKVTRYALKKESGVFDLEKLQRAVDALPEEYTLKMIDEELYSQTRALEWCCDWTAQYNTSEEFKVHALGAVVLRDGEPVSGASTYSHYPGGIEIEIDTREDYQRKGLAYVCAAKLILECEKRGLYPSWDARTRISVHLAEKLGYCFAGEYDAYEIYGYNRREEGGIK